VLIALVCTIEALYGIFAEVLVLGFNFQDLQAICHWSKIMEKAGSFAFIINQTRLAGENATKINYFLCNK
jgi:hypothetical protein